MALLLTASLGLPKGGQSSLPITRRCWCRLLLRMHPGPCRLDGQQDKLLASNTTKATAP